MRVCRVDEIEPDKLRGFAVEHATWPIMVTRLDDELVAFPGVCPHEDVSLVDYGVREDAELRCRVHGYRFDLRTGTCEHDPRLHLRRYRVTVVGDDLYVDLL
ncbi:MAG TPA: Rieske (2Fe-2S) protein [Kofleriaceae bacterium]|nr:Rieske (2Fe-2S) protein [Kofleriaceae bacterium]